MMWKLECHPALPSTRFSPQLSIWYSLQEVCKRGYSPGAKQEVSVWYNKENYKKYKSLFDKEIKKYPNEDLTFTRIRLPYKDVYGEPWKFDHVEYWGEMTFYVYKEKTFKDWFKQEAWDPCCGPECSALSYEELIIKLGHLFFKDYGSKLDTDYLTDKERKNHDKYWPFITTPCKGKKNVGYSRLDRNPKYIEVNEAELNRRWLKWYVNTPHGLKYWEGFKKYI